MENDIKQLTRRIEELEKWKEDRQRQQIVLPLDKESIDVLGKSFLRVVDEYTYFGGASDNSFLVLRAEQDGVGVDLSPGLVRYTADETTDVITIVDRRGYASGLAPNKFSDDQTVILYTTGTMPGGLSGQGLTTYYVVSAASDGYSFKLSATLGGAAINITTNGAGLQLLERI